MEETKKTQKETKKRKHPGFYSQSIKDDALRLYIQNYSAEKICRELNTLYPELSITPKTIRIWIDNYGWKEKRVVAHQESIQHTIVSAIDDTTNIKQQLMLLLKASFNSILKDGVAMISPKSLEGMMTAIDRMYNTMLSIERQEQDKFNPIEFLRLIHESMIEVPELKEALEKPGVKELFFRIIRSKSEKRMAKEIVIQ